MDDLTDKLKTIEETQKKLELEKHLLIQKGINSEDPLTIIKAQTAYSEIEQRTESNRKSYVVNLDNLSSHSDYLHKPTFLTYGVLRNMSKTHIINAIIKTRINQIVSFCEPQADKYSIGFEIRKKRHLIDDSHKCTKEELKKIGEITDFIMNCGSGGWLKDDFDSFTRKFFFDSLILDQANFEVVRTKGGDLYEFVPVDAATIRIANIIDDSELLRADKDLRRKQRENKWKKVKNYYPSYVQIYKDEVVSYFYPWELCFGVRNNTSNILQNGYGTSELEDLISIVTSLLWGEDYNRRFFKQGSAPKGILKISGNVGEKQLQSFRQEWNATMRGIQNSHKTPIIEADKVDWVDLQRSNRDMEFTQWIEFLIKISCAVYSIDPAEVNFPLSGNAGGGSHLFEGSNEARIKYSRDKGLVPLLKFFQRKINKYIIDQYDPDYELVFKGIDAISQKEEQDMDIAALRAFQTVNEIREKRGLKAVEGGDVILDGIYSMSLQQERAMQQDDDEDYDDEDYDEQEEEENPFSKAFNEYVQKIGKG